MKDQNGKTTDKEIAQAMKSALNAVVKMAREEPNVILEFESNNTESPETINEMATWLFHRRQDNGSTGN